MRKRERLVWAPAWDGPVKAWSTSFINRQKWRCDQVHTVADLLQEAFIVFMKVERRYPRVVEPANFMALYKTALRNWFHDQARYRRKTRDKEPIFDPVDVLEYRIGEPTNAGYLSALLEEAPEELRLAINIILCEPEKLEVKPWRGERENLNMKLRRILGLDRCSLDCHRHYDIVGELKSLLT